MSTILTSGSQHPKTRLEWAARFDAMVPGDTFTPKDSERPPLWHTLPWTLATQEHVRSALQCLPSGTVISSLHNNIGSTPKESLLKSMDDGLAVIVCVDTYARRRWAAYKRQGKFRLIVRLDYAVGDAIEYLDYALGWFFTGETMTQEEAFDRAAAVAPEERSQGWHNKRAVVIFRAEDGTQVDAIFRDDGIFRLARWATVR
jgi:hypothetical protein